MRLHVDFTEEDWLNTMAGSRTRYAFSAKMLTIYGILSAISVWVLTNVIRAATALAETIIDNLGAPLDMQVSDALSGVIALLIAIAALIFMGFLWSLMLRDQGALKKGVAVKSIRKELNTGAMVFEIEHNALIIRHAMHTDCYSWLSVKRVEKTAAGLVVFLEGGLFIAMPMRAFASDEAASEALTLMKRYIAEAEPLKEDVNDATVAFQPMAKDMQEFTMHVHARRYGALFPVVWLLNNSVWQGAVFLMLLALLGWNLYAAIGFREADAWLTVAFLCVLMVFLQPTHAIAGRVWRFLPFSRKRALYGTDMVKTLTLAPEGLIDQSPLNSGRIKWAAIEDVLETRSSLYFVLSEYMATVAPKRAFPDEASFKAFADKARDYKTAAQEAAPQVQDSAAAG